MLRLLSFTCGKSFNGWQKKKKFFLNVITNSKLVVGESESLIIHHQDPVSALPPPVPATALFSPGRGGPGRAGRRCRRRGGPAGLGMPVLGWHLPPEPPRRQGSGPATRQDGFGAGLGNDGGRGRPKQPPELSRCSGGRRPPQGHDHGRPAVARLPRNL